VECSFWRSRGGAEVDFVLYGENHFRAIEVKNSSQIHPNSLRSLKTFREDYPEASGMLLYRGSEKMVVDNIPCWPVDEFLRHLKPNGWPVSAEFIHIP
jgi:predicted AAA+ superfamily ATPase